MRNLKQFVCHETTGFPRVMRPPVLVVMLTAGVLVSTTDIVRGKIADDSPIERATGIAEVKVISLAGHGGEENWSSLRLLPDGSALVGMSSREHSGVLLRVEPDSGDIETVMRMDEAGHLTASQRQPKVHVTPVRDADGTYHFISHFGLDTHLPLHGSRIGYEGMRWWQWHPKGGGRQMGLILPGEGAVGLVGIDQGRILYISTFPQSLLIRLDTRTGRIENLGRTNGVYAPRHILIGPHQRPYVLDHGGQFWSLNEAGDGITPVGTTLPSIGQISGDVLAQGFVGLAPANDGGYYATSAWGRLYRITWDTGGHLKVEALAMPARRVSGLHSDGGQGRGPAATIAGLAQAADGDLYLAVSGYNQAVDGSGDSFLMRCRPDGAKTELIARLDGTMIQYLAGCQAVDRDRGRVLFVGSHMTTDSPYLLVIDTNPLHRRTP